VLTSLYTLILNRTWHIDHVHPALWTSRLLKPYTRIWTLDGPRSINHAIVVLFYILLYEPAFIYCIAG